MQNYLKDNWISRNLWLATYHLKSASRLYFFRHNQFPKQNGQALDQPSAAFLPMRVSLLGTLLFTSLYCITLVAKSIDSRSVFLESFSAQWPSHASFGTLSSALTKAPGMNSMCYWVYLGTCAKADPVAYIKWTHFRRRAPVNQESHVTGGFEILCSYSALTIPTY